MTTQALCTKLLSWLNIVPVIVLVVAMHYVVKNQDVPAWMVWIMVVDGLIVVAASILAVEPQGKWWHILLP